MEKFTLNLHGRIRLFDTPLTMGILNVTPDSFFEGSRTYVDPEIVRSKVAGMLAERPDIIDVGGCSTRPGAPATTEAEELERVEMGCRIIREFSEDVIISVDTFRASVARRAVELWGADVINDISGGLLDREMIPTVAELHVPYIITHMRGTPATMDSLTDYPDGVVASVASELHSQIVEATQAGIADIIVDPGFGFAKTEEQNWELMRNLPMLRLLLDYRPMLAGISRKSMLYKPLGLSPSDVLAASVALNTMALNMGVSILRVHDVAAARQTIFVCSHFPKTVSSYD